MRRILFCNIGWANRYNGELDDKPTNYAKYLRDGGTGHEIANFALSDGFYYGFVETKLTKNGKPRIIAIENIDSVFKESNRIDDVLVIWCATKVGKGKYIVGWYKNATVFRPRQKPPANSKRAMMFQSGALETDEFMIKCSEDDAVLLAPESRDFYVPTARVDGFGFGQSFLWYPSKYEENEAVKQYIENVLQYIGETSENIEKQIEDLETDSKKIIGAEKDALVKVRIGQSEYRKRLLARDGCCRLCGMDMPELLIASHIKPWRKCDKLEKCDGNNGILLCPNHDALFDRGLISFDDEGNIIISDKLSEDTKKHMGIFAEQKIDITPEMKFYLEWHRKNLTN